MRMLAAIGDVHGCADELQALLDKLVEEFAGREALIIMLGDYIDRGPNARGVLDILRAWDHPTIEMRCLKGNHDLMMIETVLHDNKALKATWMHKSAGGEAMIPHFGDSIKEYAQWMEDNLEVMIRTRKHLFVHAGIDPLHRLDAQVEDDVLWIRDEFLNWSSPFQDDLIVVHGHTPVEKPDQRINRIGLDTGCVFGYSLTAAVWDEEERLLGYVSVPSGTKFVKKSKKDRRGESEGLRARGTRSLRAGLNRLLARR